MGEENMFELQLEARLKNAKLVRARETLGLTQEQVADAVGVRKLAICQYENLKRYPAEDIQRRICDFYTNNGVPIVPAEVFPAQLKGVDVPKYVAVREIPAQKLLSLSPVHNALPAPNALDVVEQKEVSQELERLLQNLPERNQGVVRLYFGLHADCYGKTHTLGEIADRMGVSGARVGQLINKTVERLRTLKSLKGLREYFGAPLPICAPLFPKAQTRF